MKLRQKYNKAGLILLLVIWGQGSFAQKDASFVYLDSLSYQQYLQEDWSALIKTTRKAYKNNMDYYYMRMRTGIAYYEKQRYMLAEKHFEKAEEFNDIDKINKEYIYYSKLFSGKQKDSYLYYYKNESQLKKSVDLKKKGVAYFNLDVVYHNNPVDNVTSLFQDFHNGNPIDGEQLVTLNYRLTNFKLAHDLSKNLRLVHGGSLLYKNSYYYLNTNEFFLGDEINGIKQIQYYGGLNYIPIDGLNITGAVHFLRYSFPTYLSGGSGMGGMGGMGTSSIYLPGYSGNFLSSRISAYKYIGLINIGGGISYSTLNYKKQLQKDYRLVIYPLGNLNLYTVSTVFQVSDEDDLDKQNYTSLKQEVGFKALGNIWMEAMLQFGEIKNYTDHNGFCIYNGNDTQTSRFDFSLIHTGLKSNIRLMASYLEYYNYYFDLTNYRSSELNKIESSGLTFIGEISWKF